MDSVLVDARQLASGTIATLTGIRDYASIDETRIRFMRFIEDRPNRFRTWQDAWGEFRSPRYTVTSYGPRYAPNGAYLGCLGTTAGLTRADVLSHIGYARDRGQWLRIEDETGRYFPMRSFAETSAN